MLLSVVVVVVFRMSEVNQKNLATDQTDNENISNRDENVNTKSSSAKQDDELKEYEEEEEEEVKPIASEDGTEYESAEIQLPDNSAPSPSKTRNRKTAKNKKEVIPTSLLSDEVSDDDQLYHERNPHDVENAGNVRNAGNDDEPAAGEEVKSLLPKRYVLLLMIFLGFAVVYSLRVNINVAIVAMVNNRTSITRSGKISVHVSIHQVFIIVIVVCIKVDSVRELIKYSDHQRTLCSQFILLFNDNIIC